MKRLQTDPAAPQTAASASHKKRPVLWVLILCLLMAGSVVISVALLGGSLLRFSREETNLIALALPEEADPASGGKGAVALSAAKAEPVPGETAAAVDSAASAGSTASPQHTGGASSNSADQPEEYRGELQVHDDARVWSSETHVDLFRNSYNGTVGSAGGEKVIAPGTSNFYAFTLKNSGNIPLDYTISLEVETHLGGQAAGSAVPLEWRLLTGGGAAVSDWQECSTRTEVLKKTKLDIRHQDQYTIEWRWAFERGEGMDAEDTGMGDLAAGQALGVDAAIYIYAEQSADWDGKTPGSSGIPKTGDLTDPLVYMVLLAASACGLLILFAAGRREKKDEGRKHGRKEP